VGAVPFVLFLLVIFYFWFWVGGWGIVFPFFILGLFFSHLISLRVGLSPLKDPLGVGYSLYECGG